MEKRPISLTIIGWWLVISAILTVASMASIAANPMATQMLQQAHVTLRFHEFLSVVGGAASIACAYGIFKGRPWARVLYVAWGVAGLVIGYYLSPIKSLLLVSLLLFAVIIVCLFSSAADRWFSATGLQLKRQEA